MGAQGKILKSWNLENFQDFMISRFKKSCKSWNLENFQDSRFQDFKMFEISRFQDLEGSSWNFNISENLEILNLEISRFRKSWTLESWNFNVSEILNLEKNTRWPDVLKPEFSRFQDSKIANTFFLKTFQPKTFQQKTFQQKTIPTLKLFQRYNFATILWNHESGRRIRNYIAFP